MILSLGVWNVVRKRCGADCVFHVAFVGGGVCVCVCVCAACGVCAGLNGYMAADEEEGIYD